MTAAPFLLVIAGPNGSGKTTLTNRLRSLGFDFGTYINADEIAAKWQTDDAAAPPEASRKAQIEADRQRRELLARRGSYSFETVMSHPSKIDEMLEARALGYEVSLYFVGVDDPLINVRRVAQRVARGGHDVPEDKIVARYHRTMELLPKAMIAANRSVIFDNSDLIDGVVRVASAKSDGRVVTVSLAGSIQSSRHWFVTRGILGLQAEIGRQEIQSQNASGMSIVFTPQKP
jgi:predicted ABC-type ATPase